MASAGYKFGTHASVIYDAEALKTNIYRTATANTILGRTPSKYFSVPPQQVDLTLQSSFYGISASFSAPFGGSEYQFGTHSSALYNAEALKSQLYPAALTNPGWLMLSLSAGPDPSEYVDLQPSVYRSSAAPPVVVQPIISRWIYAAPEQLDRSLVGIWGAVGTIVIPPVPLLPNPCLQVYLQPRQFTVRYLC